MNPQQIKLTDVGKFAGAGLPWTTIHQARWAIRKRHEYGIEDAFVRYGRLINIDVPKFHELAHNRTTGS